MADREFVFSHPDVQNLIREKFVPLAMDDWYLRRQEDGNGKFFMAMTGASPRGEVGDNTRQGRYVFTAAGKFLGFNNNRGPDPVLAMLRDSLTAWEKLPERERTPAGAIADAGPEPRFHRSLPINGAVVKVYTRVLETRPDGTLGPCTVPPDGKQGYRHRGFGPAIDHLWLREEDLTNLVPDRNATPGVAIAFPPAVALRIARFHLTDNTRGEPPHWKRSEVKTAEFRVTPETATSAKVSGRVHLETRDAARGFIGTMEGWLEHRDGKLTELKAAVTGDHWGQGPHTRGARPGKAPIGFALVLCPDPKPADSIPPQGSRWTTVSNV